MQHRDIIVLQKILEGPDKPLKSELIKNLIDNCFVLIIVGVY